MSFLAEASNPATAPDRLRDIAINESQKDPAVFRALTSNPNTPTTILLSLANDYPHEFLDNPILPLLSLEDPGFARGIMQSTALRLLRLDEVPSWLLTEFLSREKPVSRAAELHVAIAGEAGEEWESVVDNMLRNPTDSPDMATSDSAWKSPRSASVSTQALDGLPDWLLVPVTLGAVESGHPLWSRMLAWKNEQTRAAAARLRRAGSSNDLAGFARPDPTMPAEELEMLANGGHWARTIAARHPNTRPTTLLRLAQEGFPVGDNPEAPGEVLEVAAEKPNNLFNVARHPNTRSDTLRRLAKDNANRVRTAVARNPATPPDILGYLATDPHSFVRGGVARNPSASRSSLAMLARDAHAAVRWDVARNPDAPAEALRDLATDNDAEVLDALLRRDDLPDNVLDIVVNRRPEVKDGPTWLTQSQILRRVEKGSLVREDMVDPDHELAQVRLARSSKTSGHTLEHLARKGTRTVAAAVAANPNALPETLTHFLDRGKGEVCNAAAANPRTPLPALRALFFEVPLRKEIPPTLASNPALSRDIIDLLVAKKSSSFDEALVRNPATPRDALVLLAERITSLDHLAPILRHKHASRALKAEVRERLVAGALLAVLHSITPLGGVATLASSETSEEELTRAATSTEWLHRLAVARHPRTPCEVILDLQKDGNRYVRAAARATLAAHGVGQDKLETQ